MIKRYQSGVYVVEFALVSILLLTVLLGIIDFGRIMFLWNASAEATRVGARISVVCDIGAKRVLSVMGKFAPVDQSTVRIDWYDSSGNVSTACTASNCVGVSVSISGLTITPVSPASFIGFSSLTVPPFSTYLSREIMGQDKDSMTVCN